MVIAISTDMINSLYNHWGMHLTMLKDSVRMDAYHRAIRSAVRPGQIVIDIGSGTGILAFIAAKAGARRVYAIERGNMITLARQLAEENQLDNIVKFIPGDSREISVPEKADVIISELIGIFALHENMLAILLDARKRFLKNGGQIIPSNINLYVVAIESAAIFNQISLNPEDIFGLDFSKANNLRRESLFAIDLRRPEVRFLSDKALFSSVDIQKFTSPTISYKCAIPIKESGMFHGFGGYWDSMLFNNVILSTDPKLEQTHWLDAFFPVDDPFYVNAGDEIVFQFFSEASNDQIRWNYSIEAIYH
jgi:type I protein arginine methyltransferase